MEDLYLSFPCLVDSLHVSFNFRHFIPCITSREGIPRGIFCLSLSIRALLWGFASSNYCWWFCFHYRWRARSFVGRKHSRCFGSMCFPWEYWFWWWTETSSFRRNLVVHIPGCFWIPRRWCEKGGLFRKVVLLVREVGCFWPRLCGRRCPVTISCHLVLIRRPYLAGSQFT